MALLLEYAFTDGGVLRWMMAAGDSVEAQIGSAGEESATEAPPAEETSDEDAGLDESETAATPPAAAPQAAAPVARGELGLHATTAEPPLPYKIWLSALWPGMSRQDVELSRAALADFPQVHRPPYGNGSDGHPIAGHDIDGYQVFPLAETPPLAVALLYSNGKLHRWMVYEQDTRALDQDAKRMLALYAALRATPETTAAAPADSSNRFGDPSFETDSGADDEWSFDDAGGDAIGARTNDAARTGRYSLTVQGSRGADRGWPGWHSANRFPVERGQTYLLRAYAMSPDGASAWLDLQLYDRDGNWLGGQSTGCRKDVPRRRDWDVLELRMVADDPRVASVAPGLLQCLNYSQGRSTMLYFDEVFWGVAPES